jgi:DNA-binding CsgD family transcriptional regulator
MNNRERSFIAIILGLIVVLVMADLFTDFSEGISWSHLLVEGLIAFASLSGIFFLFRGSIELKHSLEEEKKLSRELQKDAEEWRSRSRKFLAGLSQAIDSQLTAWKLTESEKQVAFLLLKGLSLKEIAEVRKTMEKTARAQSMAIYSKSGLAGRSELSAFFLEDLLMPQAMDPA